MLNEIYDVDCNKEVLEKQEVEFRVFAENMLEKWRDLELDTKPMHIQLNKLK